MNDVHFDFEAALVLAAIGTGIFWLIDLLWLRRRRMEGESASWLIEFCSSFFPVIVAVLLLRALIVEPFRIPSSSMVPTLLTGDFILVNKFAYGLRLPVLHTEFVDFGEPERGDVMVFRYPPDPSKDFIKRVVGLPGDEIIYRDKQLTVNGEPVPMESLGRYNGEGVSEYLDVEAFTEVLGEHTHTVLSVNSRGALNLRAEVPENEYFVMGDNRDNSADSRVWGFVSEHHLVGKAFMIWMSLDTENWDLRFARLGEIIE